MRRISSRALCMLLLPVVAFGFALPPALAQSDVRPVTSEETLVYAPGDGAVLIDAEMTIDGDADAPLDAASVSIGAGFDSTEDALGVDGRIGSFGTINDLVWNYNSKVGVLTITGAASLGDYETALRQVTFSNSSTNELASDRSVTFGLGSVIPYSENDHFYEFVSAPRISWTDAEAAAEARTYASLPGYLVTITSAEENDFVTAWVEDSAWIGASDAGHDKDWQWETGPEAGTRFFTQAADEDGCGMGAAATQPPGNQYANWGAMQQSEPNDWSDGCTDNENYGAMAETGLWNDWPADGANQAMGYLVEYGGLGGAPVAAPVSTVVIQAAVSAITIEQQWGGEDPELTTSFTVTPEVDGCTAEQTIALPAGDASIDVSVAGSTDDTACTYAVTQAAPIGYTVSPDEVTGVDIGSTAAFTNTQTALDALPRTGSTNSLFIILGVALAGSGCFVLGDERRRWTRRSTEPKPVVQLAICAWSEHGDAPDETAPLALAPAAVPGERVEATLAPAITDAATLNESRDTEAVVLPLPKPEKNPAEPSQTAATDTRISKPAADLPEGATDDTPSEASAAPLSGAEALVEDLLRLMEDIAED